MWSPSTLFRLTKLYPTVSSSSPVSVDHLALPHYLICFCGWFWFSTMKAWGGGAEVLHVFLHRTQRDAELKDSLEDCIMHHAYAHSQGTQRTSSTQVKDSIRTETIEKNTGGRGTSGKKERKRSVHINECGVPNLRIWGGRPVFGLSMPCYAVPCYATYCTKIRERKREKRKNERVKVGQE